MHSNNGNILDITGKPVSLQMSLEKDINRLHSFSGEDLLNIDRSIHKIRKSLKSVSAILMLYKVQFDRKQYLSLKSFIKSLSKQYAAVREPYVLFQTFNQIEDKLKGIDNCNLDELRNNLESQYNLIINEKFRNETIQQGNASIIKLTETLNNFKVNIKPKPLKKRVLISFRKSRRLFKKLNLTSSPDKYHTFRKWCKIYYFQWALLNRIEPEKSYGKNKKLFKLTEYLGDEHDLQLFHQYMGMFCPELSKISESFFSLKIKKLRKKVLVLYPKLIN
jgi:hypothetical protein